MFQKIDLGFEVLFTVCVFFYFTFIPSRWDLHTAKCCSLACTYPLGTFLFYKWSHRWCWTHHHLSAASDLRKGSVLVISPPAASSVFILFLPPNFCAHLIIQCILLNTFTFWGNASFLFTTLKYMSSASSSWLRLGKGLTFIRVLLSI